MAARTILVTVLLAGLYLGDAVSNEASETSGNLNVDVDSSGMLMRKTQQDNQDKGGCKSGLLKQCKKICLCATLVGGSCPACQRDACSPGAYSTCMSQVKRGKCKGEAKRGALGQPIKTIHDMNDIIDACAACYCNYQSLLENHTNAQKESIPGENLDEALSGKRSC